MGYYYNHIADSAKAVNFISVNLPNTGLLTMDLSEKFTGTNKFSLV